MYRSLLLKTLRWNTISGEILAKGFHLQLKRFESSEAVTNALRRVRQFDVETCDFEERKTVANLCENIFIEHFDDVNFDNILDLCDLFTKKGIAMKSNSLLASIIERICDREFISPEDLSIILKTIHFSRSKREELRKHVNNLVHYCLKQDRGLMNYSHLCSLTTSSSLYCYYFLDVAYRKLCEHLHESRTKDINNIVYALAYFNHKPSYGLMQVIRRFLSAKEDMQKYPLTTLSFAENLCVFGVYSTPLIQFCFDWNRIQQLYDSNYEIGSSLLTINTSLAIEEYGNSNNLLLTDKQLEQVKVGFESVTMDYLLNKPKTELSNTEKELLVCYEKVKESFGTKVMCAHTLPFSYFPDILIVDKDYVKPKIGHDFRPNVIHDCTVVMVKHRNNYADLYQKQFKGLHSLKIRLLSALGYKLIEVPYYELNQLNLQPKRNISHRRR